MARAVVDDILVGGLDREELGDILQGGHLVINDIYLLVILLFQLLQFFQRDNPVLVQDAQLSLDVLHVVRRDFVL